MAVRPGPELDLAGFQVTVQGRQQERGIIAVHDPDGPVPGPGIRTTNSSPGRRRSVPPRTLRKTAISGQTRLRLASTRTTPSRAATGR